MTLLLIVALIGTNGLWVILLATGQLQWCWSRPKTPTCDVCPVAKAYAEPGGDFVPLGLERLTSN